MAVVCVGAVGVTSGFVKTARSLVRGKSVSGMALSRVAAGTGARCLVSD